VISPSRAARATAAFACSGRHVTVVDEPMLAGRYPFETVDDFDARYAEALLIVYAFATRAALVVCDDVPSDWTTPCVLADKSLLGRADLIEREVAPQ
jgi:hypothetical protein